MKKILSVILACFVLSVYLYSCKSIETETSATAADTTEMTTEKQAEPETETQAQTEPLTTAQIQPTNPPPEPTTPTAPPITAAAPTEPPTAAPAPTTQAQKEPETNNRTAVPRVDVCSYSRNTSMIIGGKCEPGAMIRVRGGTEEIYTGSDHGDYLVEVPFAAAGTTTLKLTAELPGKEPSEITEIEAKPQTNINHYENAGNFGVIVGYNYMSYFADCLPDYIGSNLVGEDEIAALAERTAKKISELREKGNSAEIIYLLIPNTMKIWPEYVPKRYTQHSGESFPEQWKRGVTEGGAAVIDLTDVMAARKNDELKIWHKTDSHWTEYGAYLGYFMLMSHIAKKFPDAAPRPASDFEFYNQEVNFGDIYATLGLTISDLRETTTFARFKFDPPRYNPEYDTGHVNLYDRDCAMKMSARLIHARVQFAHATNTNLVGLNLPSVYVFRDSFEGPLHAFYTDRFSSATFKSMWNYNFSASETAALNPDYILYVISERTLKNIFYN